MNSITVNLKNYSQFWQDFASRGSAFDPSAIVTPEQAEHWLQEWYGIECRIHTGLTFGVVEMSEQQYVEFLLKWQ